MFSIVKHLDESKVTDELVALVLNSDDVNDEFYEI